MKTRFHPLSMAIAIATTAMRSAPNNSPEVTKASPAGAKIKRIRSRHKPLTREDVFASEDGAEFIPKRGNNRTPNIVLDSKDSAEGGYVSYYRADQKPAEGNDFDVDICSVNAFLDLVARRA